MIYLQNLKKQFGPKILFNDISFHLRPQERVGLVGENGTGKTTLMKVILGRSGLDSGNIVIRKGSRVAMLEQELEVSQESVLHKVVFGDPHFKKIKESLEKIQNDETLHQKNPEGWSRQLGDLQHEFERLGGYEREANAQAILTGLGFKLDQLGQPLENFSGGWRMRAELARILLQNPDVLLLDEPTNHLDLKSVIWLESFLKNFEGSILLISHDRKFLNSLVGRIVEIDRGKLSIFPGNYDAYETLKAERISQLEAQAAQQNRKIAQLEKFIERFRAKNTKATQVQSKIKMLNKIDRVETFQQTKTVQFRFPQPQRTGRIVADIKQVSKSYGDLQVYKDFSIAIERGWKIALVGDNGAGKSTLLKLLSGKLEFDSGEIKLGANVTRAYFAQHQSEVLNLKNTVLESMEEVAPHLNRTAKQSILGAFLFSGDEVNKPVKVLSGGERSRLSLARILAHPASFLLLDEPTNHLDMRSCEILTAALEDFEGTIITISHDRYFLDGIINQVWEVDEGTVKKYSGNFSDYEWAKDRENENLLNTPEIKESSKPKNSQLRKEQKRKEAEERNLRYRKLKPLETQLKKLEKELEVIMQKSQDLSDKLASERIYEEDAKEELMNTLSIQKDLSKKESDLLNEWETLSKKIEEISESLK